jgi:hypothetical protein
MQDIHNIKPPVMIGPDPTQVKLALLIAGALVLLGLLIFLVKRFWKFSSKKQVRDLNPVIPPYESALRELDGLSLKPIIDPKAFYFDLGALVKRYIGRSYGINAVEMTTQELVKEIRSTSMDIMLVTKLSHFQNFSDPFRYSPLAPDTFQVQKDLTSVKQLINEMEKDLESKMIGEEDS